jgi:hypothetical protein
MDQLSIKSESFDEKVEKVEKVLGTENETSLRKERKERVERICSPIMNVPCCEIFHSCLKRLKLFVKVLLFVICIATGVFLFCKISTFFSSIDAFFICVYEFFAGAIEWIGEFVRMAYEWIFSAFENIKEYFVLVFEFFEDPPYIIEGFFSSFFVDIKQILKRLILLKN